MAQTAVQRLQKDLRECQKDESLVAGPKGSNLFEWEAIIEGPHETPWEGAILRLDITFTEQYPNEPPAVRFKMTKKNTMYPHPNIYRDGRLCLDTIQTQWNPGLGAVGLIISIQSLLTDPNPNSPANPEMAELLARDKMSYDALVRKFAAETLAEIEEEAGDGGEDEEEDGENDEAVEEN